MSPWFTLTCGPLDPPSSRGWHLAQIRGDSPAQEHTTSSDDDEKEDQGDAAYPPPRPQGMSEAKAKQQLAVAESENANAAQEYRDFRRSIHGKVKNMCENGTSDGTKVGSAMAGGWYYRILPPAEGGGQPRKERCVPLESCGR